MYSAFRVRLLSQAQALPSLVLSRPFLTQESTYISYFSYVYFHFTFLLLFCLFCNGVGFFTFFFFLMAIYLLLSFFFVVYSAREDDFLLCMIDFNLKCKIILFLKW